MNYEENWFALRNLLNEKQRSFETTNYETFKIASRTLKFVLMEMDMLEYKTEEIKK